MRNRSIIAAASTIAAFSAFAGASVVASNPQNFGAEFGTGFYSDGEPGYFYEQQVAENFTVSSATNITGVEWAGASEYFDYADYTNFTGFRVQIFADAGGVPGAAVFNQVFSTAATAPAAQGTNFFGATVYAQAVSFAAVSVAAGNYWVSIGAVVVNPFGDAWVWADGTNDDGVAYSTTPNSGGWAAYNDGATSGAFSIIGTPVPAPASVALSALAGIIAFRRRR
ncbi:MAG TPA: hypothetical protein VK176_09715 [Phycisphaerales bacterium]|nr:hypothetical protein [Phycisphaerales bacterium]